jgi:heme-degrading monooxygenase HmoA
MIAVIFEVFPADGRKGDYLEHAARLKSELECVDGFISVERFQSLTEPDKLLSLSFWRDEDAVASWRSRAGHRASQSAGRKGVFRDYRLRVAAVLRDYGMLERREQAPPDSRAIYDVSVEHSGEATEDTPMITTMHSDRNASPPRVEVITSVQRRRRWPTVPMPYRATLPVRSKPGAVQAISLVSV